MTMKRLFSGIVLVGILLLGVPCLADWDEWEDDSSVEGNQDTPTNQSEGKTDDEWPFSFRFNILGIPFFGVDPGEESQVGPLEASKEYFSTSPPSVDSGPGGANDGARDQLNWKPQKPLMVPPAPLPENVLGPPTGTDPIDQILPSSP